MNRLVHWAFAAALAWTTLRAAPAVAEDDEEDTTGAEVVTGSRLPPLSGEPRSPDGYVKPVYSNLEELANLPFANEAYLGGEQLDMEPEFINAVLVGLDQIFRRDYNGARDTFEAVQTTYPDSAVAEVVDMLIWQALMLENFDYKYDKQYWTSSKAARAALERAMAKPGSEAWENLLLATVLGVESIHTIRKGEYLGALNLAFQAMDSIEKAKAKAPDFVDLTLADGMYNYWRSVITLSNKALPDFGDERVKGI